MASAKQVRIPRQNRSVATKEKLMEAAKPLFCEKGYYKTTANAIARQAGVSVGSFYAYFADKEAVFAEIAERVYLRVVTEITRCVGQLSRPDINKQVWLRDTVGIYMEIMLSEPYLTRQSAILYYTHVPRVVTIIRKLERSLQQMFQTYFSLFPDAFQNREKEAAALFFGQVLIHLPGKIQYGQGLQQDQLITIFTQTIHCYLTACPPDPSEM